MSLTVVTLLKTQHTVTGEGDRPFWTTLGASYLAKLAAGVRRYIGDVPIVCLTDAPDQMPDGVTAKPLLRDDPAWWCKLQQFAPETGLTGRCLYLDLDNVLAGPLDALLALDAPLVMADDMLVPGLPNGSLMLYDAEAMRPLWDSYATKPATVQSMFKTWPHAADQAYVAWMNPGVPLFQRHLPAGYLLNSLLMERGAEWSEAHLVFGCSVPKPHESRHPFYGAHWT